MIGWAGRKECC